MRCRLVAFRILTFNLTCGAVLDHSQQGVVAAAAVSPRGVERRGFRSLALRLGACGRIRLHTCILCSHLQSCRLERAGSTPRRTGAGRRSPRAADTANTANTTVAAAAAATVALQSAKACASVAFLANPAARWSSALAPSARGG